MKYQKGTTLIELLVVLMIGLTMLLAIGAISDIGKQTQRKLIGEASIYNDIAYGFKLIQRRAHGSALDSEPPPSNWVGNRLIIGSEKFGVYVHSGSGDRDFVHLLADGTRRTILSALNADEDTLTFKPNVNATNDSADVTLWGTKDGTSFNMTMYVKSRR